MTCEPDPEPCERCGAPLWLVMDHGKPIGWSEVICLCHARDHHHHECERRIPHTPQRCTHLREHPVDMAWQQHPTTFESMGQMQRPLCHPSSRGARYPRPPGRLVRYDADSGAPIDVGAEFDYWMDPDGTVNIRSRKPSE